MRLDELLIKSYSELITQPLDKISVKHISDALKNSTDTDEKKKLELLLKRRKQLDILDKGINDLERLDVPDFI